jgi:hypothetical protein
MHSLYMKVFYLCKFGSTTIRTYNNRNKESGQTVSSEDKYYRSYRAKLKLQTGNELYFEVQTSARFSVDCSCNPRNRQYSAKEA